MEELYQATEFDQQTTSHRLQIIKAALPYMSVRQQKMLSVYVKIQELTNTYHLFDDAENTLGICSLSEEEKTPLEMLESVKTYCSEREKEMLDVLSNFFQASMLYRQYQAMNKSDPEQSGPSPMENLLHLMTPEQQDTFYQYQTLFNQT